MPSVLPAIVIGVLAAATLAGCKPADAPPEATRPVRILVVQPSHTLQGDVFSGDIRARVESRLAFRVGGKVAARLVDVGAQVKAGQALARLEPTDLQLEETARKAKLAAAHSDFEQNHTDVERYRALLAQGFISQADFDRRLNTLNSARATLEAAQSTAQAGSNQTAYATLSADRAGVVTQIDLEPGQVVAVGQVVAKVAAHGEREVVISVAETQREAFQRGQAFQIQLAAGGKVYQGKLRELAPDVDAVTHTYAAYITVVDADETVKLGMTARAQPRLSAPPDHAALMTVPLTALLDSEGKSYVWVLDSKALTVKRQAVTVAQLDSQYATLRSGLVAGQEIVTAGVHLLRDGQVVRRLGQDPAQTLGTRAP